MSPLCPMVDPLPGRGPTVVVMSNLPTVVTDYMTAHNARDLDPAMACYTDDAIAVDDGNTYTGPAEIRAWLGQVASLRYTMTVLGSERVDDEHYVVTQHYEGDFPG